jgi:hypothetical protein
MLVAVTRPPLPHEWQISHYTDSVVHSTSRESEQVCASIAVLGGALLRHKLSVHAVGLVFFMLRCTGVVHVSCVHGRVFFTWSPLRRASHHMLHVPFV